MKRKFKSWLVLVALLVLTPVAASAQVSVDCDAGGRLQPAVDAARPGATILVRGVCAENVRILDEVSRITLDGQGSATIRGPNPASNTILVAGRNITIRGFTITGGRNGVAVLRGGMALIDGNTIQESSENGINVAQHSFAGIVNNTIQFNHDAGIRMLDGSFARIGFMDLAQPARGNLIRKNGAAGVLVHGSSGASLVGNSISDNDGPGVSVRGASHADLAANHIDGNGSDGVTVTQNSYLQLGGGTGLLAPPNETEVPNKGFGIGCSVNSSAEGRLATLTGAEGAKNFDRSCTFRLEDHNTRTIFDVCLQDDRSGDTLRFNSLTGAYSFTRCGTDFTLTGQGETSRRGCVLELREARVSASLNSCVIAPLNRGSATVQVTPLGPIFLIEDSNTADNTCSCR